MAKDMTPVQRALLGQFVFHSSRGGMLPKSKVEEATRTFGVNRSTIFRIWAAVKKQVALGEQICVTSKRKGKAKKIGLDVQKMKTIPFQSRNTIRKLSKTLGVSKSTIGRWKKSGVIRAHSNAIKPALNDSNKISRMKFSLNALSYDVDTCAPKFKSMTHVIHADEKWFNMSKCTEKYYVFPGEQEPYRACQSKRFIPKVMFISFVSQPIYSENGQLIFDGKVGLWPFTKTETTKRRSRNRLAGVPVTKALDSINKAVTKAMMINNVIPAIKAKWPTTSSKNIIIQWDNAPPHLSLSEDPDFIAAATSDGFNIQLVFQPPNSPDTNVNDLGWFRSIESLKSDVQAKTIDDLVTAVQKSYDELSHFTLNKVFLTLQSCMVEIMKKRGSNNYKIPHMQKDALHRRGLLPNECPIESELVRECLKHLMELGKADGLEELMADFNLV